MMFLRGRRAAVILRKPVATAASFGRHGEENNRKRGFEMFQGGPACPPRTRRRFERRATDPEKGKLDTVGGTETSGASLSGPPAFLLCFWVAGGTVDFSFFSLRRATWLSLA